MSWLLVSETATTLSPPDSRRGYRGRRALKLFGAVVNRSFGLATSAAKHRRAWAHLGGTTRCRMGELRSAASTFALEAVSLGGVAENPGERTAGRVGGGAADIDDIVQAKPERRAAVKCEARDERASRPRCREVHRVGSVGGEWAC